MKGVYVVPGSANWVNGCNKVSNELLAITAQGNAERDAYIAQNNSKPMNIATAAVELVTLK